MSDDRLAILDCGSCERFKAGVHAAACGLAAVMWLYNSAAWLRRREEHLGINAVIYGLATIWEVEHIAHHWRDRELTKVIIIEAVDGLQDVA